MRKRTTISNIICVLPLLPLAAALILSAVIIGKYATPPQGLPPIIESSMIKRLEGVVGEGVELVQLTDSPGYEKESLAWSPDGEKLAYVRHYPPEIRILDTKERSESHLVDLSPIGGSLSIELYSPDGLELYLKTVSNLLAVSTNDGEIRRLTDYHEAYDRVEDVSIKKGRAALFLNPADDMTNQRYELTIIDLQTSEQDTLMELSPANLDLSPDGKQIVFSASVSEHDANELSGIFVINMDGSELHQLSDIFAEHICWSPIGDNIAFVSQGSLFRISPNGSSIEAVPTQGGYIRGIQWDPAGSKILYWVSEGKTSTCRSLWLIDLSNGAQECLINTTDTYITIIPLGTAIEWNPDGNSLALILEEEGIAQSRCEIFQLKF